MADGGQAGFVFPIIELADRTAQLLAQACPERVGARRVRR
jgi:hypothetical protein